MADKLAVIDADNTIKELESISTQTKELVTDFKNLVSESNKVNRSLKSGKINEYATAINNLKTVTSQFTAIESQLASALARTARLEVQHARLASENARTRREVASATREESRARQQATREQQQNERIARSNAGAYNRLRNEYRNATNNVRNLQTQILGLNTAMRNGNVPQDYYNRRIRELTSNLSSATREANRLGRDIAQLTNNTSRGNRGLSNFLAGGAVAGVAGAVTSEIIGGLRERARASYEALKATDKMNMSLKQVFETEDVVADQKIYLTELTNKYGLELISTTQAYNKFAAAIKDTSLQGEKGQGIFAAFSGAGSKLGLSQDEINGILKAIEQMVSKGKIQAEELRGQLGDRMAGAFKLFADAIGVSTQELDDMLKRGDVLAEKVLPKVQENLSKVYDLASDTDTLAAAEARIQNVFTSFYDSIAQNEEIMGAMASSLEFLAQSLALVFETISSGQDSWSIINDLNIIIDEFNETLDAFGLEGVKLISPLDNIRIALDLVKIASLTTKSGLVLLLDVLEETINLLKAPFSPKGIIGAFQDINKGIDESIGKYKSSLKEIKETTLDAGLVATGNRNAADEIKKQKKERQQYLSARAKAIQEKRAFFQFNEKFFSSETGKNTGKSTRDYHLENGNIVENKKFKDFVKTEKSKASALSGIQKDYLKDLQAARDTELAINETYYTKGEISELKYLDELLRINTDFYNKKMGFLKGKNAEERKQITDANLDQTKLEKDIQEKKFNILSSELETNYKKLKTQNERASKEIENTDFFTSEERLEKQIENNQEALKIAEEHYNSLIKVAKEENQPTLKIEAERDQELLDIQDKINESARERFNIHLEDFNTQSEILKNQGILSIEERRALILSNQKLTARQREYQLSVLDREAQIEINKLEIERLSGQKDILSSKKSLNQEETAQLAEIIAQIKALENVNIDIGNSLIEDIRDKFIGIKESISSGLYDLGFDSTAAQFEGMFNKIIKKTADWKDYSLLAVSAVLEGLSMLSESQKEKRIAALDEELKKSEETTEQEIGFIDGRLAQLNALEELTAEQMQERSRLEDEARTYKEQQFQREKLIEAQKARAEQRAAAQQALINGALAATTTLAKLGIPAGLIPAGIALAFGVAQSVAISSKDPVPRYFVGRKGGSAEWAITQDGGREMITDRKGNIKSLGSDNGDQLTWLDAGDTVHTAKETKSILKKMVTMPELGDNIYRKIAMQNMIAPQMIVNKNEIDYDKLADKIGSKFEKSFKKYDKPTVIRKNGKIYEFRGANFGEIIGYYDPETGNEIIKKDDSN